MKFAVPTTLHIRHWCYMENSKKLIKRYLFIMPEGCQPSDIAEHPRDRLDKTKKVAYTGAFHDYEAQNRILQSGHPLMFEEGPYEIPGKDIHSD